MTRKDFQLIATVMLYAKPVEARRFQATQAGEIACWERAVKEFARVLPSTNAGFDRERFLAACGVEDKS